MQKIIPTLLLATLTTGWLLLAATFSGKIMDKKGAPIANVQLVFSNADTTITTHTNDRGEYTAQLPKGTYQLVLQHPAYESRTITAITIGTRNEKRNFTLKKGIIQIVKAEETNQDESIKVIEELEDVSHDIVASPPPVTQQPQMDEKAKTFTPAAKIAHKTRAYTPATTLGISISAPNRHPPTSIPGNKTPANPYPPSNTTPSWKMVSKKPKPPRFPLFPLTLTRPLIPTCDASSTADKNHPPMPFASKK